MISSVTSLTHSVSKQIIKKLFDKYLAAYGNLWSSRAKTESEWEVCINTWHDCLNPFSLYTLKKAVAESLVRYKDYPPTMGQLVDLCIKFSDIPSIDEIISLACKREFNHPIVKIVFDKVGSWTFSTAKSEQLKSKTKEIFNDCINTFRQNPQEHWDNLQTPNNPPKLEYSKPTKQEHIRFTERLKQYQESSASHLQNLKDQKHPEFDQDKITQTHRDFDANTFEEYKKYLLSVPEEMTLSLPTKYLYDRMRFGYEIESEQHLKKVGYSFRSSVQEPKRHGAPTHIYKCWQNVDE